MHNASNLVSKTIKNTYINVAKAEVSIDLIEKCLKSISLYHDKDINNLINEKIKTNFFSIKTLSEEAML
jgi:hypothetical protein